MQDRPNILFVMTDQLRPDAVGFGPYGHFPTPNLDRIAEGSVFSACQSVNPICQPARAALLTGKYPHQIGLRTMSGDLSPQHPTFARALQAVGYHTAAVGKLHYLQSWPWGTPRGEGNNLAAMREFFRRYGFDHVWQSAGKQLAVKDYCDWCAYLDERGLLEIYRDFSDGAGPNKPEPDTSLAADGHPLPFAGEHHVDEVTCREALRAMRERPEGKPFFLMASFCSPHKPFDPPQEYLDRVPYQEIDDFVPDSENGQVLSGEMKSVLWRLRRAYLATVLLVDDAVGRLLDELDASGAADSTLVLFSSDHGEMMGDHFRVQKAVPWYSSLTVPTTVRMPGAPLGLTHAAPVELTDLTATILDAAGIDPQEALSRPWPAGNAAVPCRSLLPMVRGETDSVREFSFSEGPDWECLCTRTHKYVRERRTSPQTPPVERLFDWSTDPAELENLAARPESAETLEWFRARREWVVESTPPAQMLMEAGLPAAR
ncbi:MAG: sulfatase-like hydrolase/transferase [Opitutales bacterium]|nr:sulfatase-like hydrolase/transferase [Opitutales bacterium]